MMMMSGIAIRLIITVRFNHFHMTAIIIMRTIFYFSHFFIRFNWETNRIVLVARASNRKSRLCTCKTFQCRYFNNTYGCTSADIPRNYKSIAIRPSQPTVPVVMSRSRQRALRDRFIGYTYTIIHIYVTNAPSMPFEMEWLTKDGNRIVKTVSHSRIAA